MTTSLDALGIRRRLGRDMWGPPEPFGPDGWRFLHIDWSVLITCASMNGAEWVHASIAGRWPDNMPSYDELVLLHRVVWPNGHAYQCFVPPAEHININPHALHLWGRLDGARVLPNFGAAGSI